MDVQQVHRGRAIALCGDGTILNITSWIDDDGDECAPADAVAAVAGHDSTGWVSIDLSEFDFAPVH